VLSSNRCVRLFTTTSALFLLPLTLTAVTTSVATTAITNRRPVIPSSSSSSAPLLLPSPPLEVASTTQRSLSSSHQQEQSSHHRTKMEHSWKTQAHSNKDLIDQLKAFGIIKNPRVEAAMRAVDRKHYSAVDAGLLAYKDWYRISSLSCSSTPFVIFLH
jgi:hypothetical protein